MPSNNGLAEINQAEHQSIDAQAALLAAANQRERTTSHSAKKWSVTRVIVTSIGMVGLGIFFLALHGILHPDLAFEALQNSKAAVELQLKDASSAEYRNVRVYSLAAGKMLVCGEVNARNSFGAMAGYVRFIAPGTGLAIIETDMADQSSFDHLWDTLGCTGAKGDLIKAE